MKKLLNSPSLISNSLNSYHMNLKFSLIDIYKFAEIKLILDNEICIV